MPLISIPDLSRHCLSALPEGWRLCGPLTHLPRRIMADPGLATLGLHVPSLRLPLCQQPVSALKSGSSTLMLGAALVLTADLLPPDAAQAVLALAQKLRFHPDNFRKSRPVLEEIHLGSACGRIVRDGTGRRAYLMGSPSDLLARCSLIWDGQPRAITSADAGALPEDDCPAFATAEVVNGALVSLTYLGSITIAPAVNTTLLRALKQLEDLGFDCPDDETAADDQADVLYIALEPTHTPCLIPPAPDAPGLAEAVLALCDRLRQVQERLHRRRRAGYVFLALGAGIAAFGTAFLTFVDAAPLRASHMLVMLSAATVLLIRCCKRPRSWKKLLPPVLTGISATVCALLVSPVCAAFAVLCGVLCAVSIRAGLKRLR